MKLTDKEIFTMSYAHQGIDIMQRRGEAAGRQWLLEHQHQAAGPSTAAESGVLVLEDGSTVTIGDEQYSFHWSQDGHEFALNHPVSDETYPWPHRQTGLSEDQPAATIITILLGRYEDEVRKRHSMQDRAAGDPILDVHDALRAAPSLEQHAVNLANGYDADSRLTDIRDQFLEECADRVADRLPTAEIETLLAATQNAVGIDQP